MTDRFPIFAQRFHFEKNCHLRINIFTVRRSKWTYRFCGCTDDLLNELICGLSLDAVQFSCKQMTDELFSLRNVIPGRWSMSLAVDVTSITFSLSIQVNEWSYAVQMCNRSIFTRISWGIALNKSSIIQTVPFILDSQWEATISLFNQLSA